MKLSASRTGKIRKKHTSASMLTFCVHLYDVSRILLGLLSDANYNIPKQGSDLENTAYVWPCNQFGFLVWWNIKVLVLHVFRFMRYVFLVSIDQEELTISKVPFDFLNSATLFSHSSFALPMSVTFSLTHSSSNSCATSKTLSLRRLTGIGFDPRFILFWRLVTESSH